MAPKVRVGRQAPKVRMAGRRRAHANMAGPAAANDYISQLLSALQAGGMPFAPGMMPGMPWMQGGMPADSESDDDEEQDGPGPTPLYGKKCLLMIGIEIFDHHDWPRGRRPPEDVDAPGVAQLIIEVVKREFGDKIVAADKEPVHTLKARWEVAGLVWELQVPDGAGDEEVLDYQAVLRDSLDAIIQKMADEGKTPLDWGQCHIFGVVIAPGCSHESWLVDYRAAPGHHDIRSPRLQMCALACMCKAWKGKSSEYERRGIKYFLEYRAGRDLNIHSPQGY